MQPTPLEGLADELTTGGSMTGKEDWDFPLAGHTSEHLVHVNQTLGRSKWTKSFIDWLYGLWTNTSRFTMNHASPVSHHLSSDPHVSDQCRGPTYQPRFSSDDAMLTAC